MIYDEEQPITHQLDIWFRIVFFCIRLNYCCFPFPHVKLDLAPKSNTVLLAFALEYTSTVDNYLTVYCVKLVLQTENVSSRAKVDWTVN